MGSGEQTVRRPGRGQRRPGQSDRVRLKHATKGRAERVRPLIADSVAGHGRDLPPVTRSHRCPSMRVNPEYSRLALASECKKVQTPGSHTRVSGRRYYSPSQGRFLGRDPLQERGGLNLYGFTGNNPVNRWDVLGMMTAYLWEEHEEVTGQWDDPDDGQEGLVDQYGWVGRWVPYEIDDESTEDSPGSLNIQSLSLPGNRTTPKGKVGISTINLDKFSRREQEEMARQFEEAVAFLRANSPTLAKAIDEFLKASPHGITIVPHAGTGGTRISNQLVVPISGDRRENGSIVYPAYTLAHEIGHLAQSLGLNPQWNLPNDAFAINSDGTFPEARRIGENSAEYYAYHFAQQVSAEIVQNAGRNIGSRGYYYDVGLPVHTSVLPPPP